MIQVDTSDGTIQLVQHRSVNVCVRLVKFEIYMDSNDLINFRSRATLCSNSILSSLFPTLHTHTARNGRRSLRNFQGRHEL